MNERWRSKNNLKISKLYLPCIFLSSQIYYVVKQRSSESIHCNMTNVFDK